MTSAADMLARIRSTRQSYQRNENKTIKLKEGKTRVRILENPKDLMSMSFRHDVGIHWIKADRDGKPLAVVGCPDKTFQEECAVCTLIDKVIAHAPDDETKELAKSWKPRRSVLLNVLIRDGENKSETPVILDVTVTTFDAIMSIYENYYEENSSSAFDPKTGIDLMIERKGKGLDTEYNVIQTSRSAPVPQSAIDGMVDLKEFIKREYFRAGEEQKALRVIQQITGMSLNSGSLAGPSRAGLLTSSGAVVHDAGMDDDVVEEMAKRAAPAEPKKGKSVEAAPEVADDFDDDVDVAGVLDELDGLDDD
jgi:hypothetical protein